MRAERRGDGVAYERPHLALMLRRRVRTPLAKVGLRVHEAEDVVQEILIGLHAKRHTWDETRPLVPGLYTITRDKFIDAGRRLRREASWRVEITSGAVRRAGLLSEPNVSFRAIRLPYGS
jgi:RNA polymerase sigma-70 factor (ECF subfamily)